MNLKLKLSELTQIFYSIWKLLIKIKTNYSINSNLFRAIIFCMVFKLSLVIVRWELIKHSVPLLSRLYVRQTYFLWILNLVYIDQEATMFSLTTQSHNFFNHHHCVTNFAMALNGSSLPHPNEHWTFNNYINVAIRFMMILLIPVVPFFLASSIKFKTLLVAVQCFNSFSIAVYGFEATLNINS